jgi:hypothetical protein
MGMLNSRIPFKIDLHYTTAVEAIKQTFQFAARHRYQYVGRLELPVNGVHNALHPALHQAAGVGKDAGWALFDRYAEERAVMNRGQFPWVSGSLTSATTMVK